MWTLSTMFYLEVKGWTKNSYKNSIKLADSILWSGEKEGDKEQNYIGDKPFEQQPLSLVWKNKNAAWLKNRGNLYKKRVHKHFFIIWDLLETKMSDWRPIGDQHIWSETDMPDQRPTCLIGDWHAWSKTDMSDRRPIRYAWSSKTVSDGSPIRHVGR